MIVMTGKTAISLPIRFNPFKHHRNYAMSMLKHTSTEELISMLDTVCNNYIDIYIGDLTPETIGNEVVCILNSKHILQSDDFARWVASKRGYRQIELHDRSEWIVRKSDETERYIHIHPARTGLFTIRFKGSTLKTVYLLRAQTGSLLALPSLGEVNRNRIEIGLSQVKKLEQGKGILKCYREFFVE